MSGLGIMLIAVAALLAGYFGYAKWLEKNEFNTVNWLPADIEVIDFLKNYL